MTRTRAMTRSSPWTPLRERTFRMPWLAQLGSNIGTWMQESVAAQWLLVGHVNAATLGSLVQTASLLPVTRSRSSRLRKRSRCPAGARNWRLYRDGAHRRRS